MKKFFALVVFAILATAATTPTPAHASSRSHFQGSFEKFIEDTATVCKSLYECRDRGIFVRTLFDRSSTTTSAIPNSLFRSLQQLGANLTNIWPDSILEGDYDADPATRLDKVEGIFLNNQMIGFWITYSANAWYTGECDFYKTEKHDDCQPGRIVEKGFVSRDQSELFEDGDNYAEFYAGLK